MLYMSISADAILKYYLVILVGILLKRQAILRRHCSWNSKQISQTNKTYGQCVAAEVLQMI